MQLTAIAPPCSTLPPHSCPPLPPGPTPPPAPIPPGEPQDFAGVTFARTTGEWWRPGDEFQLQLGARVGSPNGYGTWTEAVTAAALASAGSNGAVAIADDRGRLYLHVVRTGCFGSQPLHMGLRGETGYAFDGTTVRGIIDGDRIASRGDCLHPWVPVPPLTAAA